MNIGIEMMHPVVYAGIKGNLQMPVGVMGQKISHSRAKNIRDTILAYYKIDEKKFVSKSRKGDLVNARQIFSYLCRQLTALHDADIADYIKRDRTTVIHSVQTVNGYIKVKHPEHIIEDIENIKQLL